MIHRKICQRIRQKIRQKLHQKICQKICQKKYSSKICQINSSNFFSSIGILYKEPEETQSNNEFHVIYKSGPFMAESWFLELRSSGKLTASLKRHYIFN